MTVFEYSGKDRDHRYSSLVLFSSFSTDTAGREITRCVMDSVGIPMRRDLPIDLSLSFEDRSVISI